MKYARFPDLVSVRLKPTEKTALHRHADDRDMTASALGRRYFIEGLERDGVVIEA